MNVLPLLPLLIFIHELTLLGSQKRGLHDEHRNEPYYPFFIPLLAMIVFLALDLFQKSHHHRGCGYDATMPPLRPLLSY
jgi:hypothetical protein